MADPFIGEICIFPYTFAPYDWGYCNGSTVSISQFSTLYAILGTNYGGNGQTNFDLPNLEQRVPLHVGGYAGTGPGLSSHYLGYVGGSSSVTLIEGNLPSHDHSVYVENYTGSEVGLATATAVPGLMLHDDPASRQGILGYSSPDSYMVSMDYNSLAYSGASIAHENRQPSLVMHYFIAMDGIFPPRS